MLKGSYRDVYCKYASYEELECMRDCLNIQEVSYKWNEKICYKNKPELLIFHHTAIKEIDVIGIDQLHKNKGWSGIGYNYFIDKKGIIYKGRDENAVGAHTLGFNDISIGICLEGDFECQYPNEKQINSLEKLSLYLCLKYDIKDIIGHNDVGDTLCPGKNFEKEKIKNDIIKMIKNYKN